MDENLYNCPVFEDVAECTTVCVTYEVTRETLIRLDYKINGPNQNNPASLYSIGYKVLNPLYKNEKIVELLNNKLASEEPVRNLMMCTHMMRNGLTYLTFFYKLKSPITLTYTTPPTKKFWPILEPRLELNDCSTLSIRLKQLSERILSALDTVVSDNPIYCAEIVSNTAESYFNNKAEIITSSSIIHRGQEPAEIVCTEFEQGKHSAFYIPYWIKLPFFGFFVQSGNTAAPSPTDRLGIEMFSPGPYICMSLYAKVNQDFKKIEADVSKFLYKKNHTDLESLTFISSFSDRLHAVSEKISILLSASDSQIFADSYINAFQSSLRNLQNRASDLQSFIRARHPLKESLLQVEQIKTNKIFSFTFALLAAAQIIIALINVDWTDSNPSTNNIYKNITAIYQFIMH